MACSARKGAKELQRPHHERGPPMEALDVLLETARVLRRDGRPFAAILLLLLCPLSAALLSDCLVDRSLARTLSDRAVLLSASSGLPQTHFVEQLCRHLVGALLSAASSFPLLLTFLVLARASIAYSVACCYAGKKALASEFSSLLRKIWRNLVSTCLCSCGATLGCLVLFLSLLLTTCSASALAGTPHELILYTATLILLSYSVAYAHVVIVCNLAGVICVLEDSSGTEAVLRSVYLVRGQTQVGFLMFLGSTMGMLSVEGLLEHRAKSLISDGHGGSSWRWEGPLLVLMYSAVVLVDSMMSAVFYFACRASSNTEEFDGNGLVTMEELKLSSC